MGNGWRSIIRRARTFHRRKAWRTSTAAALLATVPIRARAAVVERDAKRSQASVVRCSVLQELTAMDFGLPGGWHVTVFYPWGWLGLAAAALIAGVLLAKLLAKLITGR